MDFRKRFFEEAEITKKIGSNGVKQSRRTRRRYLLVVGSFLDKETVPKMFQYGRLK
jgi:hypothetical protein